MNELLLKINNDNSILLLGYRVHMTPIEHKIISFLAQKDMGYSGKEISRNISFDKSISAGSIAVHICNINKKARPITKRILIEGNRRNGYKISNNI